MGLERMNAPGMISPMKQKDSEQVARNFRLSADERKLIISLRQIQNTAKSQSRVVVVTATAGRLSYQLAGKVIKL